MHYELWHTPSGNLMGTYATEAEALAIVRAELRALGRGHAETLVLLSEDSRGRSSLLAESAGLVARAEAADPERAPLSA